MGIPPCDHNLFKFVTFLTRRLVDCNTSGCDREGDIDWHMAYTVTVQSLNPTQSNILIMLLQTAAQYKPHTKLEIVNGVLYQKLLFGEREEQVITPSDCVIFNDGTKSEGCSQEEFKPFVSSSHLWHRDYYFYIQLFIISSLISLPR